MKQLSGLDASFLHLETPETPMHVGGLHLFDLPEGYRGDFFEDVKAHVASRMHLADIFTKKLGLMPFDLANPVWTEDSDIDLDYHIRRVVLPSPGSMAQLEAYVGRLHSHLLDRSRPLWQFYIFESLQSGQAALYTKLHHAALDGQGAHALAQAILDLGPEPRTVAPAKARTDSAPRPGANAMLGAALRNTATQCWKMAKSMPDAVKAVGGLMLPAKGEDGKRGFSFARNFRMSPRTPLNVSIASQRAFATARIPLAEAKGIAKAFDASLNDVVMTICSSALRRYLEAKDALPDKPLTVALPVSLRERGNNELNNQVSMMLVGLATDQTDPKARIAEIVKSSQAMKATLNMVKSALPTDFPSLGMPWLMSGLAALWGRSRLADRIPPIANVAISNVPGVPVPLYLAGARMASYYPASIVVHGLALNITVQSYNGALDFGLIACRRALPDVRELAGLMAQAHLELLSLAAADAPTQPVKRAAKTEAAAAKTPTASVTALADKMPARKKTRTTSVTRATKVARNGRAAA